MSAADFELTGYTLLKTERWAREITIFIDRDSAKPTTRSMGVDPGGNNMIAIFKLDKLPFTNWERLQLKLGGQCDVYVRNFDPPEESGKEPADNPFRAEESVEAGEMPRKAKPQKHIPPRPLDLAVKNIERGSSQATGASNVLEKDRRLGNPLETPSEHIKSPNTPLKILDQAVVKRSFHDPKIIDSNLSSENDQFQSSLARTSSLDIIHRNGNLEDMQLRAAKNETSLPSCGDIHHILGSANSDAAKSLDSTAPAATALPALAQGTSLAVLTGVAVGGLGVGISTAHSTHVTAKANRKNAEAAERNAAAAELNADVAAAKLLLDMRKEAERRDSASSSKASDMPSDPLPICTTEQRTRSIGPSEITERERRNILKVYSELERSKNIRKGLQRNNITLARPLATPSSYDDSNLDNRLRRVRQRFFSDDPSNDCRVESLIQSRKGKEKATVSPTPNAPLEQDRVNNIDWSGSGIPKPEECHSPSSSSYNVPSRGPHTSDQDYVEDATTQLHEPITLPTTTEETDFATSQADHLQGEAKAAQIMGYDTSLLDNLADNPGVIHTANLELNQASQQEILKQSVLRSSYMPDDIPSPSVNSAYFSDQHDLDTYRLDHISQTVGLAQSTSPSVETPQSSIPAVYSVEEKETTPNIIQSDEPATNAHVFDADNADNVQSKTVPHEIAIRASIKEDTAIISPVEGTSVESHSPANKAAGYSDGIDET